MWNQVPHHFAEQHRLQSSQAAEQHRLAVAAAWCSLRILGFAQVLFGVVPDTIRCAAELYRLLCCGLQQAGSALGFRSWWHGSLG